jgi:hypothetical protein
MSDVRLVTATLWAEAGRLSSAIANSEGSAIQPIRKMPCGFLMLNIGSLLGSRNHGFAWGNGFLQVIAAAISFLQSIGRELRRCLFEVKIL